MQPIWHKRLLCRYTQILIEQRIAMTSHSLTRASPKQKFYWNSFEIVNCANIWHFGVWLKSVAGEQLQVWNIDSQSSAPAGI